MSTAEKESIYIVAAKRTAIGAMLGQFSDLSAPTLASFAIKGCLEFTGLAPDAIDQVLMGCVLQAGIGQAPARQAALKAGLSTATVCTTINKMCGSGMQALMMAADLLRTGQAQSVLAGGMESMTNAPYLLPNARKGFRLGHTHCIDHLFFDGLEDAYQNQLMGVFAERCATKFQFTREAQDAYATESVRRARLAIEQKQFVAEICPINSILLDEPPGRCMPEKIAKLKPAFQADGTLTAANSSSISDGAAALILMTARQVRASNIKPIARLIGYTAFAQAPEDFATAPIGAIQKLLAQTGLTTNAIDLWEINEAFAVVTMAAMQALALNHQQVNIRGGACALGHPIGASGARILVTLLHALQAEGKQRGIAALCIGGGEATAMAIELCG